MPKCGAAQTRDLVWMALEYFLVIYVLYYIFHELWEMLTSGVWEYRPHRPVGMGMGMGMDMASHPIPSHRMPLHGVAMVWHGMVRCSVACHGVA